MNKTRKTNLKVVAIFIMFAIPFILVSPPVVIGAGLQKPGGVQVDNTPPQLSYTGTTNNSALEWELDGAFTASWDIVDNNPNFFFIYWNQSGSNTTYSSGSYTDAVSGNYDPGVSDINNIIFFQLWCNDTIGYSNSSIVLFSVVNTNPPTLMINRPENTTYGSLNIEIWISSISLDLAVLWWAIFYENGTLLEGNVTWTQTVTRSMENGQYSLRGYCNDTAGIETDEIVYFTVKLGATGGPAGPRPDEPPVVPPFDLSSVRAQVIVPQLFLSGLILAAIIWFFEYYPEVDVDKEMGGLRIKVRRQISAISTYYKRKQKKQRKANRNTRR